MPLRALIFDVDGTIAETEELHRAAFNDGFAQFGLDWHWSVEDYAWLLKTTGGKERMRKFADEKNIAISDELIAQIHKWKTARYGELMAKGDLPLRQGIKALIEAARQSGLKVAVATTTNLPNVEILAKALFGAPINEVFDTVAAGDMVKNKKPAPDVYLLALEQLALPATDCVAFEDTRNGVRSAQGAGLRVILSQSGYSKDEPKDEADFVVSEFSEAMELALFRDILNRDKLNRDVLK